MQVILASASPRRRELIKKIEFVSAEVVVSNCDETSVATTPWETVKELALKKAKAVFATTGGLVIGADTVVSVDGKILGKPNDEKEAKAFFKLLCGRSHEVYTGVAVVSKDKIVNECVKTEVIFLPYDEEVVNAYISSGSPFDKAGGYGIQDEGIASLVGGVNGDFDNVVGLPVERLKAILKENFS